jgi:hypothetical protein
VYFKYRASKYSDKLTEEFWTAFAAYISEIEEEGWLSFYFGSFYTEKGPSGEPYPIFKINNTKLKRRMAQEIGFNGSLDYVNVLLEEEMGLNIIEFLFKYVSKPGELKGNKIAYIRRQGALEYTVKINALFDSFKINYRLARGEIKRLHHKEFDKRILNLGFDFQGDEELADLITTALLKFYSRDKKETKIGLEKLVDAYQRLKTLEGKNPKKSLDKITDKITGSDPLFKEILKNELFELWQVANKGTIRHFEKGIISVKKQDFIEYLFYRYWLVIELIMKQYSIVKS